MSNYLEKTFLPIYYSTHFVHIPIAPFMLPMVHLHITWFNHPGGSVDWAVMCEMP